MREQKCISSHHLGRAIPLADPHEEVIVDLFEMTEGNETEVEGHLSSGVYGFPEGVLTSSFEDSASSSEAAKPLNRFDFTPCVSRWESGELRCCFLVLVDRFAADLAFACGRLGVATLMFFALRLSLRFLGLGGRSDSESDMDM